jgi:hypothetical protein
MCNFSTVNVKIKHGSKTRYREKKIQKNREQSFRLLKRNLREFILPVRYRPNNLTSALQVDQLRVSRYLSPSSGSLGFTMVAAVLHLPLTSTLAIHQVRIGLWMACSEACYANRSTCIPYGARFGEQQHVLTNISYVDPTIIYW